MSPFFTSPNHDRYMVYKCLLDGYYKVMSNIPKMGHLPTPDLPLKELWHLAMNAMTNYQRVTSHWIPWKSLKSPYHLSWYLTTVVPPFLFFLPFNHLSVKPVREPTGVGKRSLWSAQVWLASDSLNSSSWTNHSRFHSSIHFIRFKS